MFPDGAKIDLKRAKIRIFDTDPDVNLRRFAQFSHYFPAVATFFYTKVLSDIIREMYDEDIHRARERPGITGGYRL